MGKSCVRGSPRKNLSTELQFPLAEIVLEEVKQKEKTKTSIVVAKPKHVNKTSKLASHDNFNDKFFIILCFILFDFSIQFAFNLEFWSYLRTQVK